MKITDLIYRGVYYTTSKEGGWLLRFDKMGHGGKNITTITSLSLENKDIYCSPKTGVWGNFNDYFRPATQKEVHHLELCEKERKYVPYIEMIKGEYEIY